MGKYLFRINLGREGRGGLFIGSVRCLRILKPPGYQSKPDNVWGIVYVWDEREFDDLLVAPSVETADVHMGEDADVDEAAGSDPLKLTENRPAEAGTPQSTSEPSASKTHTKPSTANKGLVADGVKLVDENLEPRLPEDKLQIYYVIAPTWYAH